MIESNSHLFMFSITMLSGWFLALPSNRPEVIKTKTNPDSFSHAVLCFVRATRVFTCRFDWFNGLSVPCFVFG